jgi:divalent metal cation (Fe/Co/Zn/Cd) transporter
MSKEQTAIRLLISIVGNTILAIIKGFAGFFALIHALIADAIRSTTDIFASF